LLPYFARGPQAQNDQTAVILIFVRQIAFQPEGRGSVTTLFEMDGRAAGLYTRGANIYDCTGRAVYYIAEGSAVYSHGGDCRSIGYIADGYFYKYDGSAPVYFGVD
jgi:4-fold beta flower protein